MTLAACVLFYEKVEQTLDCIESLLPAGIKVYVLNNGSSEGSRRALGRRFADRARVEIHDTRRNLGVARGRNYLIRRAGEDWLLFLDNDIRVKTKRWLGKFRAHLRSDAGAEVLVPARYDRHGTLGECLAPPSRLRISGRRVLVEDGAPGSATNSFPGGAAFVRRSVFERLGLYDGRMFVGLEDRELCIRALRAGRPVRVRNIKDIELIHEHRPAANDRDKKAVLTRYSSRHIRNSHARILRKHRLALEEPWEEWLGYQVLLMTRGKAHAK